MLLLICIGNIDINPLVPNANIIQNPAQSVGVGIQSNSATAGSSSQQAHSSSTHADAMSASSLASTSGGKTSASSSNMHISNMMFNQHNNTQYLTIVQDPYPPLNNSPDQIHYDLHHTNNNNHHHHHHHHHQQQQQQHSHLNHHQHHHHHQQQQQQHQQHQSQLDPNMSPIIIDCIDMAEFDQFVGVIKKESNEDAKSSSSVLHDVDNDEAT